MKIVQYTFTCAKLKVVLAYHYIVYHGYMQIGIQTTFPHYTYNLTCIVRFIAILCMFKDISIGLHNVFVGMLAMSRLVSCLTFFHNVHCVIQLTLSLILVCQNFKARHGCMDGIQCRVHSINNFFSLFRDTTLVFFIFGLLEGMFY